ncbi:MAG TPA: hypothetical protein V6D50_16270 [Chroococcales cyanobacterium]|jgi:hypothetical protein
MLAGRVGWQDYGFGCSVGSDRTIVVDSVIFVSLLLLTVFDNFGQFICEFGPDCCNSFGTQLRVDQSIESIG